MKLKKGEWFVILFSLTYILGFTIFYLLKGDYEFLLYASVLMMFFILIAATFHKTKFSLYILWGLSIWGLLHMAGGGVIINNNVLYALKVAHLFDVGDTYILKFDQVVHFFGFAVTTFVANHLLKPHLNKKANKKLIYSLLVLIGMGAGALNEVIEFMTVIFLERTGVGGYYNNVLDLVFNTLGSLFAILVIHINRTKYRK